MSDPRLSFAGLKVLSQLLRSKSPISGADLTRSTHVNPGTIYPLLRRLEEVGWIVGTWEPEDPRNMGRPRKKTYVLTNMGCEKTKAKLVEL